MLPITFISDMSNSAVYDNDPYDYLLSPVVFTVVPTGGVTTCANLGLLGFSLVAQTVNMAGWPVAVTASQYDAGLCQLQLSQNPSVGTTAFNTSAIKAALFRISMCFNSTGTGYAIASPPAAFALTLSTTLTDVCGAYPTNSGYHGKRSSCNLSNPGTISSAGQYIPVSGGTNDVTASFTQGIWTAQASPVAEGSPAILGGPNGLPGMALNTVSTPIISGCRASFLVGTCSIGADVLSLPSTALDTFAGAASLSLTSPLLPRGNYVCGGATPLTLLAQAPPAAYAALLSSLTFSSGPSNSLSSASWRQVQVTCGVGQAAATDAFDAAAYVMLRVTPVNDPPAFSPIGGAVVITLPENSPPIVEVTVSSSCGGRVAATSASTSLCFVDPDPVVGAGGGLEVSSYTLLATGAPYSWSPVGALAFDCSAKLGALTLEALTAGPTPCWRQRFALAPAPFDYENLPTIAGVLMASITSFTLTVTDTYAGLPLVQTASQTVQLVISDADDPAFITMVSGVASVVFNDATSTLDSVATGSAYPLLVTDQDSSDTNRHYINLTAVSPPDGSAALQGLTAAQLFYSTVSGPAVQTGGPFAFTYSESWTLAVRPGFFLASLPAKAILLNATVWTMARSGGNATVGFSVPISVRITRANK